VPRALTNPVAGIDGRFAIRSAGAQIRMPGFVAASGRGSESLTNSVGAFQTAEIGAISGSRTRDKETHRLRRRLRAALRRRSRGSLRKYQTRCDADERDNAPY